MHRTLVRSTLAVALATALSSVAIAQTPATDPGAKPAATSSAAKDNPYLVVQDTWIYVIDEPGVYLDRARDEIGKKQYKLAATNLRKAAAMVNAEADRAGDDAKTHLKRDAAALQVVAGDVVAGKVTNAKLLDEQLSQARADLASHHYAKAAEAWAKKDYAVAGRSLAAAARYVESGFTSLGQRSSADVKAAASYGDSLADQGANATDSDFNTARDRSVFVLTTATRY